MMSRSAVVLIVLVIAAAIGSYFILSADIAERRDLAESGDGLQQPLNDAAEDADEGATVETAAEDQDSAGEETAERTPAQETSDAPETPTEPAGTAEQPESRVEPSQASAETGAPSADAAGEEEGQASAGWDEVSAGGQEDAAAPESPSRDDEAESEPASSATNEAETAGGDSAQSDDDDASTAAATESADKEQGTAAEEGAEETAQTAEQNTSAADETVVAALPKAPLPDEDEAPGEREEPKAEPGLTPPSFDVVRIERDGALVAAGRSPQGSRVFLLRDGKVEAEAEADRRGNWVLILDRPLPPGDHELLLEARLPSGETIRSSELVVASVPGQERPEGTSQAGATGSGQDGTGETRGQEEAVAIAVPQEGGGARVLQGQDAEENEGLRTLGLTILSVDYDAEGFIKVAGLGIPDATVLAYLDNAPIGRTKVAADERWLIAPENPIEEGLYQLRIDQLNEAGEVVARLETVFARTLFIADLPLERMVVVEPGNSLWRLARRLYGEGILYSVIYDANQDQIRDPDLIYPGQIFLAPRQLQAN